MEGVADPARSRSRPLRAYRPRPRARSDRHRFGQLRQSTKRRPNLSARNIWERDGATCQYTGRKLAPHEGNIDHVVHRSRGGRTSWGNCVLAHREINSGKADKLPEEAGPHLRRKPAAPPPLPTTFAIRNVHRVRDWEYFLKAH